MNPSKFHILRTRAFTLLELLVATAVTLILMVTLLGITQNMLDSYSRSTESAKLQRDANFALDAISADIQGLSFGSQRDAEVLQSTLEDVNAAPNHWLVFNAGTGDADPSVAGISGIPRAVSYRVAWQDTVDEGGSNPSFALYRTVEPGSDSLVSAVASSDLKSTFWAARPTTDLGNYLVGNVIEFSVRLLPPNGLPVIQADAPGDTIRLTQQAVSSSSGNSTSASTGFPLAAEIGITILSDRGMAFLRDNTLPRADVLARFSRSFTRKVPIPSSPGQLVR